MLRAIFNGVDILEAPIMTGHMPLFSPMMEDL